MENKQRILDLLLPALQETRNLHDLVELEYRAAEDVKISQPMLATIQNEQKRTGVTDKQILAMRDVKAKKIEDMTVLEYKKVMSKFQKTPDLQREAEQDE